MIYFVQAMAPGHLIKIGYSDDKIKKIRGRLCALRNTCAVRIKVLALRNGSQDQEKELHSDFASYRQWGEWFLPSAPLLAFIAEVPAHPFLDFVQPTYECDRVLWRGEIKARIAP